MEELNWPAHSSELISIQHLWDEVKSSTVSQALSPNFSA